MGEQTTGDRWAEHLQVLGLTELEALAQSASYRVRSANSYQFDLEYTGSLARYRQPGKRLRTFTSAEEATMYLNQVKRETEERAEALAKLLRHRGHQGWRIRPYPSNTALWLAENYIWLGRGNMKGWRSMWDEKRNTYRTFQTPEEAYDALLAEQEQYKQE